MGEMNVDCRSDKISNEKVISAVRVIEQRILNGILEK